MNAILEKTAATAYVAWENRAALLAQGKAAVRRAWDKLRRRLSTTREGVRAAEPVVLLLLCIALGSVILGRILLARQMAAESAVDAAALAIAEAQERQETARALELAATEAQHKAEAEAVARVLYGTARNHSEEAKRAVVWCIINRVESAIYPDSVIEVCAQPVQWMGYSEDNPVIESLYTLAEEVLTTWRSGGYRPMSPDYLYLSWTSDEIILRDSWEETSRTHYWRA